MKYLVVDFEATCQERDTIVNQEIIEFPCIIIDGETGDMSDNEFHKYVRPIHNPKLTGFCTSLTGIEQKTVDKADTFPVVFKSFRKWLDKLGIYNQDFILVCCGDWDFRTCLPKQAQISGIKLPGFCYRWMNIKKIVQKYENKYVGSMLDMLKICGDMELEGRHHSGIDDTRNIARCLQYIIRKHGSIKI